MAKSEQSPAYLWYPKDVMSSGRVSALTALEELWYRRALDQSWLHEGMPADPKEFAGWVGRNCTTKAAEKIIATFFTHRTKNAAKVFNAKQELLRKEFRRKSKERSLAGIESGRKRRERSNLNAEQLFNKTLTKPNIPIPSSSSSAQDEKELPNGSSKKHPRHAKAKVERPVDSRKDHPAIAAVREIAECYPPKPTWDLVIGKLGDKPDTAKLKAAFETWCLRGYKPTNYAWATEWYPDGIPDYSGKAPPNLRDASMKGKPVERDWECDVCHDVGTVIERKPGGSTSELEEIDCPKCRSHQKAA